MKAASPIKVIKSKKQLLFLNQTHSSVLHAGFVRPFFACLIGFYKLNLARPEIYKIFQATLKQA